MRTRKNAPAGAHTKEKLLVYRKCLINCLSVLTMRKGLNKITVCEPFAGSGRAGPKLKGSASHAVEVIDGFLKRDDCKCQIELLLNDLDSDSYLALCKKFSKRHFVSVTNICADDFINNTLEKSKVQRGMFFIDPYGYTQVNRATLDKLFEFRVDIIIFVPTHHIYRFAGKGKKPDELHPVSQFLSECGIDSSSFDSVEKLEEALVCNFKQRAKTDYVFDYALRSQGDKFSHHCLFFITKNIVGAEKFLEGMKKVRQDKNLQQVIPGVGESEKRRIILKCLTEEVNNRALYELLVKERLLSPDANPILRELEKGGIISVKEVSEGSRSKNAFYLGRPNKVAERILIKKN